MTVATDIKESLMPRATALVDRFVKECIDKRLVPDQTYKGRFTVQEDYKLFGLFKRTREREESCELAGWQCPDVEPDLWILENGAMCYISRYQRYTWRGVATYQYDKLEYQTPDGLKIAELNILIEVLDEHFKQQPAT